MKVTFPADYGAAELAGKDAVFKCTIKEIREFVDKPADGWVKVRHRDGSTGFIRVNQIWGL